MRYSASNIVRALLVACLASALAAPVTVAAKSRTRTHAAPPPDSTRVDGIPASPAPPVPPKPPQPVRKRIIIGGSGIRVDEEGTPTAADSGTSVDVNINLNQHRRDHGDDIVRMGESVFVGKDEVVPGSVVVFRGNAIIEGTVAGSVVVVGGEIRARRGAEIRGDVVAIGGAIQEDDEVVIRGEKIVVGGLAGTIGNKLDVSTRVVRAGLSAMLIFVALVLSFVTMLFLRARVERVSAHISASLLKCFGAGVLTSIVLMFALAIVTIPLIIVVIGIPLAVILYVSCVGVYVIACTAFVYAVGRRLTGSSGAGAGVFVSLLVGLLVLCIPVLIAFLLDVVGRGTVPAYLLVMSVFLWAFAYVVGLGAIVLSRFGSRPVEAGPPAPVAGEPAGAHAA